jgi:hypothetical protein
VRECAYGSAVFLPPSCLSVHALLPRSLELWSNSMNSHDNKNISFQRMFPLDKHETAELLLPDHTYTSLWYVQVRDVAKSESSRGVQTPYMSVWARVKRVELRHLATRNTAVSTDPSRSWLFCRTYMIHQATSTPLLNLPHKLRSHTRQYPRLPSNACALSRF